MTPEVPLTPEQLEVIRLTEAYVRDTLQGAEGGHDWHHTFRVWRNARHIASGEKVDGFIVELGALLHDIADSKFHGGDEEVGPRRTRTHLESLGVEEEVIHHVERIVRHISFKGGHSDPDAFSSRELEVVRDADRLDAIGAIGIARAFSYGGHKGRAFYDPDVPPRPGMSKEEYKHSNAPTVNHFHEKLLLLRDLMHTDTARRMAEKRHRYMEDFLRQFHREWDGL